MVWDGKEITPESEKLAAREILKSRREMQGIPRWWNVLRRLQLWRNRHDQSDDGDVDVNKLEDNGGEQEGVSLSELLAGFEVGHQSQN